jgi:hypothetical protein
MRHTTTVPPRRVRPTRAEQETVARWDDEEKVVHLWSASPVTWRKLARLGIEPTRETTRDGELTGRFYRLPLARFLWGLKRASSGTRRNLATGAVAARDPGRRAVSPALTTEVGA